MSRPPQARGSPSARGRERGPAQAFDFGPSIEELLENCLAETGLEPPTPAKPLRWSPLQDGAEALGLVRERDGLPAPAGD